MRDKKRDLIFWIHVWYEKLHFAAWKSISDGGIPVLLEGKRFLPGKRGEGLRGGGGGYTHGLWMLIKIKLSRFLQVEVVLSRIYKVFCRKKNWKCEKERAEESAFFPLSLRQLSHLYIQPSAFTPPTSPLLFSLSLSLSPSSLYSVFSLLSLSVYPAVSLSLFLRSFLGSTRRLSGFQQCRCRARQFGSASVDHQKPSYSPLPRKKIKRPEGVGWTSGGGMENIKEKKPEI